MDWLTCPDVGTLHRWIGSQNAELGFVKYFSNEETSECQSRSSPIYVFRPRSAIGIEAQREAIARFAAVEGFEIAAEHVEIETGKRDDALDRRPNLNAALAEAKLRHCQVAVAKLDR
jgi:hypothetical protein